MAVQNMNFRDSEDARWLAELVESTVTVREHGIAH